MMTRPCWLRVRAVQIAIACLGLAASELAATMPDWMAAATRASPTIEWGDAPAVVLFEESVLEIDRDARRTTQMRRVIKVLTEDGRRRAAGVVSYSSGGSKVTGFRAWLLKPDRTVVELGKKKIVDVAVYDGALELYSDARKQVLSAADVATVGAVFGYEAVVTTQTVFNQERWVFQNDVPTELSRVTVKLPPGWALHARARNAPSLQPEIAGNVQTWTSRSLPAWPDEPMSISPSRFAPAVQIDILPPSTLPAERAGIPVGSWPELARHLAPAFDRASQPGATVRTRAALLTSGATTRQERIRLLAQFVQSLNYISILLDSENGGGFVPRPAERVLQAGYGDCKDKATLLRALLAGVGVDSYPLIVYSGAGGRIEEDWPSTMQFNHCILAIRLDEEADATATITHPALGRLLVFDPTDGSTPLGQLNGNLAAHGLLLSSEGGGLIELPAGGSAASSLLRTVEAELSENGDVRASITERLAGPGASTARREFREVSPGNYRMIVERWLGASLPALRNVTVEPQDRFEAGEFELTMRFTSLGYGKRMRDELLVFKPVLVARRHAARLAKRERRLPVAMRASSYDERSVITLPPGYAPEEMPKAVVLETPFGRYRAECRWEEGRVVFERALQVRSMEVPVADYEAVRSFYERIYQTEQSPVVLRRRLE